MSTRVGTSLPNLIPCPHYFPAEAAYGGQLRAKPYQDLPNFTANPTYTSISLNSTTYTYSHFNRTYFIHRTYPHGGISSGCREGMEAHILFNIIHTCRHLDCAILISGCMLPLPAAAPILFISLLTVTYAKQRHLRCMLTLPIPTAAPILHTR